MRTALLIIGAILLLALVAAGSFWGGMAYQSSQVDRVRANFEAARGPIGGGQFPEGSLPDNPMGGLPQGGQSMRQGMGFFGGEGTTGQVKTVEGNVMTVSTAQDVTTVKLSADTQIEKSVAGTLADLQPGTRVLVAGERDSDGNITASQVRILNNDYPGPDQQAAPGTEP
jgi:hypothetical protein